MSNVQSVSRTSSSAALGIRVIPITTLALGIKGGDGEMITLRTTTAAFLLVTTGASFAEVSFPNHLYDVGDCITPLDPIWNWFGIAARVIDLVYSMEEGNFAYLLEFVSGDQHKGLFGIAAIDANTAKLTSCPD